MDQSEERHRRAPSHHDQGDEATLSPNARDPSGDDRHEERPGAGRGVEKAERSWAAVIQRERDRGEQRARQSEDHGVEVDEIDRLDHGVRADVAKAVADRAKHRGPGVFGWRGHRSERDRQQVNKTKNVIASMA